MKVATHVVDGQYGQRERIPMVRPVLPSFEELEPGVRSILSSGMVTKEPTWMNSSEQWRNICR
jgi:hypothetical protein